MFYIKMFSAILFNIVWNIIHILYLSKNCIYLKIYLWTDASNIPSIFAIFF